MLREITRPAAPSTVSVEPDGESPDFLIRQLRPVGKLNNVHLAGAERMMVQALGEFFQALDLGGSSFYAFVIGLFRLGVILSRALCGTIATSAVFGWGRQTGGVIRLVTSSAVELAASFHFAFGFIALLTASTISLPALAA